ncbi:hypothetical protein Tsubulata_015285 [Turnera subulata]|uniref:Uncharacterized protein n=1 Tax=Turnera subulata TaxID=218843 RepID=A0A9Q0J7V7_9ROSI|nr:hypothetical protein Tsubulata_015285 [Turnera subulata]
MLIPTKSLLLFYTLERILFKRLVGEMGKEPDTVKEVMAIWLVLEEVGFRDLIRVVQALDGQTIEALFREGLICLRCINPNTAEQRVSEDIPVLRSLCDEPINCRFFLYHRQFLYKRYMEIMEAVCSRLFAAGAATEGEVSGVQLVIRPFGERTSGQGEGLVRESANVALLKSSSNEAGHTLNSDYRNTTRSALNPRAKEFLPGKAPEEERAMFLTFSKGRPLSRQEIAWFFHSNWGSQLESIFIEQPATGSPPLFGKVIFNSSLAIPRVLNGKSIAKFWVNGKHLWVRSYVPHHIRSRRNQVQNQDQDMS